MAYTMTKPMFNRVVTMLAKANISKYQANQAAKDGDAKAAAAARRDAMVAEGAVTILDQTYYLDMHRAGAAARARSGDMYRSQLAKQGLDETAVENGVKDFQAFMSRSIGGRRSANQVRVKKGEARRTVVEAFGDMAPDEQKSASEAARNLISTEYDLTAKQKHAQIGYAMKVAGMMGKGTTAQQLNADLAALDEARRAKAKGAQAPEAKEAKEATAEAKSEAKESGGRIKPGDYAVMSRGDKPVELVAIVYPTANKVVFMDREHGVNINRGNHQDSVSAHGLAATASGDVEGRPRVDDLIPDPGDGSAVTFETSRGAQAYVVPIDATVEMATLTTPKYGARTIAVPDVTTVTPGKPLDAKTIDDVYASFADARAKITDPAYVVKTGTKPTPDDAAALRSTGAERLYVANGGYVPVSPEARAEQEAAKADAAIAVADKAVKADATVADEYEEDTADDYDETADGPDM